MRVAQLVETLAVGGAQRLVVDIAAARAAAGDDSHVIVCGGPGPFSALLQPPVAVHYLHAGHVGPRSILPAVVRLRRLIAALELDVLQTHLPGSNYLGLAVAWRGDCRVFPTVHNTREFDYGDDRSRWRGRLRRRAYRKLLDHGEAMVAVSEAVRRSMITELDLDGPLRDRIVAVPNGTRLPAPPDAARRAALRAERGVGPDEVLIVGMGRLGAQKNFGDLVAALAALPADGPPWRCLVAGEGEGRAALAAAVEAAGLAGRMTLAGRVDDAPALLAAADVFCLPSLWEGLPLALLEALAAGLPVAAYAIDGVVDVVADGREALLAPPGRPDLLAARLQDLRTDPARRRALGEAGRALVSRAYSLDRLSERLGALYAGREAAA